MPSKVGPRPLAGPRRRRRRATEMATELFPIWGLQTGWRSQGGDVAYQVSATLDGICIWYRGGSRRCSSYRSTAVHDRYLRDNQVAPIRGAAIATRSAARPEQSRPTREGLKA